MQRTAIAGFFGVQGVPTHPMLDVIPPSKIKDLDIRFVNFTSRTVHLTWTAVGDDYDNGKGMRLCSHYGQRL